MGLITHTATRLANPSDIALNELGLVVNVVRDYNASGSAASTTGSISAGSAVLTLAAAEDFKNGQGISIYHAGPGPYQVGTTTTLAAPTSPTVANHGTAGTTTYKYWIAALDALGGITAAVSASTTTGNATLGSSNWNVPSWTASTGAASYAVWGDASNPSGSQGYLGNVSGTSLIDHGQGAQTPPPEVPTTPPGTSLGETLFTTISSGGGTTTLTLAATATVATTSQPVCHDDTAAFAAWASALSNTITGYIPPGTHNLRGFTLPGGASCIYGGGATTILQGLDATTPVITVNQYWSGSILDMIIKRNTLGCSLGDGIHVGANIEQFLIGHVYTFGHANGIKITGLQAGGWISKCWAANNALNGFSVTDPNLTMSECYSEANGSNGYNFITTTGGAAPYLFKCEAFANGGDGFSLTGSSSAPISDAILEMCISGSNGAIGIYLDTYGTSLQVKDCYVELNGLSYLDASIINAYADGIDVTVNNSLVSMAGNQITQNAENGYNIACNQWSIIGGYSARNSAAGSGLSYGININSGVTDFTITGVRCTAAGPTDQDYGINLTGTNDYFTISGCDCRNNVGGAIHLGGTTGTGVIRDCPGYNPVGHQTETLPASGSSYTNTSPVRQRIFLTGGTMSALNINNVATGIAATPVNFELDPGETFTPAYSSAPTMTVFGL